MTKDFWKDGEVNVPYTEREMAQAMTQKDHLDALLSRLRALKPGEPYSLDPYERKLILDEIEWLRAFLESFASLEQQLRESRTEIIEVRAENARLRSIIGIAAGAHHATPDQ